MTKIKMDQESLTAEITNVEEKVSVYRTATVNATAQFSTLQNTLQGEAYTSLVNSINKTLETQKTLVAQCVVLINNAKNFAEDISSEESSVTFG